MASKLHDLIALAREPSSERRRELLREVTDLFFATPNLAERPEMALFDDVLSQLAHEMETAVRAELAERMADAAHPPQRLLNGLAADVADVAAPVLARSTALSPETLLAATQSGDQGHLRAISRRVYVPEQVSQAIVERGDDDTVSILLRNEGAALSRATHEAVVERASANPALHQAVVDRKSLPMDLLNEMYFVVEARLREQILQKNADLDASALEAALNVGRKQVAARDGALPADYAEAEAAIRRLRAQGQIGPSTLAALLRNGEVTKFLVALSELAEVDFHTARRILERRELDPLAIVCKAAGFDRALFLTFAVLILGQDEGAIGRAREYGQLYADLSLESAQRTIRFWRMRRQIGDVAAA